MGWLIPALHLTYEKEEKKCWGNLNVVFS